MKRLILNQVLGMVEQAIRKIKNKGNQLGQYQNKRHQELLKEKGII